jgi:hypothetical protein
MANRGERTNYLSLALQARSAIKRLRLVLVGGEPTPELKSALGAALNSLSEPTPKSGSVSRLHDEAGFNRFEEIQTVEEVIRVLDDPDLRDEIARICAGKAYTAEDVRAVIGFFSAVENRALYHYDDPSLAETFR